MIRFMDWWYKETCSLPNGFIILLFYLVFIRTFVMKLIGNLDYITMDGIVFFIMLSFTMAIPQIKEELLKKE